MKIIHSEHLRRDEIGIDTSKLESAVQSTLSLLIPSQNFVGIIDIVGLNQVQIHITFICHAEMLVIVVK